MTLSPRAVVVTRRSELAELVARHGTRAQAGFYLRQRDRSLEQVQAADDALDHAVGLVLAAIPADWRRARVDRDDLDRFAFAPEDVVVVVGQDGLVANVAKYLAGQPVVGIDPEPGRNVGVLVPHPPEAISGLLAAATSGSPHASAGRTMVEAVTDDGQRLLALNELYVGHPSHQSARYRLQTAGGRSERQSSSGVLVGTGTGATSWCRSVALERKSALTPPQPGEARLCWFVREAWPSPVTGTDLTEGQVRAGEHLTIHAESDQLVVFGDGIERDAVPLLWGQRVTLGVADERLRLIE